MFEISLFQPQVPPNTGNIIRLCANTGAQLHLIHPLGFAPDEKKVRRAGLDYHEWASVIHYADFTAFLANPPSKRIFACSSKTPTLYHQVQYQAGDCFLLGPETRGLPEDIRERFDAIRIPMRTTSRSLNLSNAAAIILYEAWRQLDFISTDPK